MVLVGLYYYATVCQLRKHLQHSVGTFFINMYLPKNTLALKSAIFSNIIFRKIFVFFDQYNSGIFFLQ